MYAVYRTNSNKFNAMTQIFSMDFSVADTSPLARKNADN